MRLIENFNNNLQIKIMKQIILIFTLSLFSLSIYGQDAKFTVSVSTDSILMGNTIKVSFALENGSGKNFDPPAFKDFDVVGGPNQSSSFSMVNGDVSQSLSYSYYLQPKEVGTFFIEPASIGAGENVLETLPIEINVYPNPDGVEQNIPRKEREFDFWGTPKMEKEKQTKPKKKRKVYKM